MMKLKYTLFRIRFNKLLDRCIERDTINQQLNMEK